MVGWMGTAAAYDASFGRLCAGTVDDVVATAAGGRAVRRWLDVGCGCGAVAEAARQALSGAPVGHEPIVHGCDAAVDMITFAARAAPTAMLVTAALPHLPYRDAVFDAVTANFVVNHVPDPLAAIRELRRVTGRGRRVVLTIWPPGPTPVGQLWEDVITIADAVRPVPQRLAPEHEFDRSEAGLTDLLDRAGLTAVDTRLLRWTLRIPGLSLWAGVEAGLATIGTTYRAQDPATRMRMRQAYVDLVRGQGHDGWLVLPASALIAAGTRSPADRPLDELVAADPRRVALCHGSEGRIAGYGAGSQLDPRPPVAWPGAVGPGV